MYDVFHLIENINKALRIKLKIIYWKLKYGKRIKIGKNLRFRKGLIINISKDGLLEIGNNCFFNNYCSINCRKHIIIGKDNIFGEGVKIYDHNHIFNNKTLDKKNSFKTREIRIGDNNWIGSNVIILSKTIIKSNNVIGSGTVLNTQLSSDKLLKAEDGITISEIKYANE